MTLRWGRKQSRGPLAAVLLAAAVVVVSSPFTARPGQAAPVAPAGGATMQRQAFAAAPEPTAWDHNISGNTVFRGRPEAVNPLILFIQDSVNRGGVPLVIGIQEACRNQMDTLLNFLKRNIHPNYAMDTWISRPDVCGGYGNAVFVLAGATVAKGSFTQLAGDERRGYVCMRSGFGFVGCTAHLVCPRSCGDPAKAAEIRIVQLRQYRDIVLQTKQRYGASVYWGGDLYVYPGQMESTFPEIIRENREADECETPTNWRDTQDSGPKADWLFLTEPAATPCPHDAKIIPVALDPEHNQDHHILASYQRPARPVR